jgi:hypothetical protein
MRRLFSLSKLTRRPVRATYLTHRVAQGLPQSNSAFILECKEAIAAVDASLGSIYNWKALPLSVTGRHKAVAKACTKVALAVAKADALTVDDISRVAAMLQLVREYYSETALETDESVRELYKCVHTAVTQHSAVFRATRADGLPWLRLLIELTHPDASVAPTDRIVAIPLRQCLSAFLQGFECPGTLKVALFCHLAVWPVLRVQSTVVAALWASSLRPEAGAHWYMRDVYLLSSLASVSIRDDAAFEEFCAVSRRGIHLNVLSAEKLTTLLTRIMSLSSAPVNSSTTAVQTQSLISGLLSATAATLAPVLLTLQVELQHRPQAEEARVNSRAPGASSASRQRWNIMTVSAMISVFAHAGDFELALHRSFLEQLVAHFIELHHVRDLVAQTRADHQDISRFAERVMYSRFYYAISLLLAVTSNQFGARIRALIPSELYLRGVAAFVSSHPEVQSSPEVLDAVNFICSLSPLKYSWKQEWTVPDVQIPVDLALPEQKLIVQLDGPSHFVYCRPNGASASASDNATSLSIDDLLPETTKSGGYSADWKRAFVTLEKLGFTPQYSLRAARQDALFLSLGYTVVRIPLHLLEERDAYRSLVQDVLDQALASCAKKLPRIFRIRPGLPRGIEICP